MGEKGVGDHGWEDRIAISTESVRPNWWPPNSLCLWPQQPSQGNSTDAYCHQAVCRLAAPAGPPTKGPFPTCSDLTAPLPLNAFRKVKSDSPAFPHRSPLDQRKAEPLERESGIPCTSVLEATLRLTLRHLGKSRFLKESWLAFGRMNLVGGQSLLGKQPQRVGDFHPELREPHPGQHDPSMAVPTFHLASPTMLNPTGVLFLLETPTLAPFCLANRTADGGPL